MFAPSIRVKDYNKSGANACPAARFRAAAAREKIKLPRLRPLWYGFRRAANLNIHARPSRPSLTTPTHSGEKTVKLRPRIFLTLACLLLALPTCAGRAQTPNAVTEEKVLA